MNTTNNDLCPICGGVKRPGTTLFSVELGFGVFEVRNVPATVCSQCGEEWFDASTTEQLERMTNEARQAQKSVEVVQFAA